MALDPPSKATSIAYKLAELARDTALAIDLAEAELRTSESRYRRLFETALDGILLINFETGMIEDVNPYLCAMLDYTHEEFSKKKLWEVGAFANIKESKAMFDELRTNGHVRYEDLPLLTKAGKQIDVEFVSNSYDCDGVIVIQCNIRDITERVVAERKAASYLKMIETTLLNTVGMAINLSALGDPYTVNHEQRVAAIASAIGAELGFDQERQTGLKIAASLHDVGKNGVPSQILSKPGKIGEHELRLVKEHCRFGYNLLNKMEWPWPVAEVAFQHHERMDGSGYPGGLKGDAIILEARIIGVADVVEAMASHRPYRPALGLDIALAEIEEGSGTRYDPIVVSACLSLFRKKNFKIPNVPYLE